MNGSMKTPDITAMAALLGAEKINSGSQFTLTTGGRFKEPLRPHVPPSIHEPYRASAHRIVKGRQRNEPCPCGCGRKRKNCKG